MARTSHPVDPERERRRAWATKAAQAAREHRKKRVEVLRRRQPAIEEAVRLFRVEMESGRKIDSVNLRPGLVFKKDGTPAPETDPAISPHRAAEHPGALSTALRERVGARPPLGQLVHRRGAAVPLLMTALGLAAVRHAEGERADFTDINNAGKASWAKRIGDADRLDIARRHVVDGVKRLLIHDLVALQKTVASGGGYSGWRLLNEDASGGLYTVPTEFGLRVPLTFWSNGWAQVLTPGETAAYLMVIYQAQAYISTHNEMGVGAAPSVRQQQFGITKEIYATLNELEEFGLVERTRSRQIDADAPREVDKFQLRDGGLNSLAFDKVTGGLRSPMPRRLSRFDPL